MQKDDKFVLPDAIKELFLGGSSSRKPDTGQEEVHHAAVTCEAFPKPAQSGHLHSTIRDILVDIDCAMGELEPELSWGGFGEDRSWDTYRSFRSAIGYLNEARRKCNELLSR